MLRYIPYGRSSWLVLLGMLFFNNGYSQLLNNEGGLIQVNGVDLFVAGGAGNRGTINNNGILTVSGDWNNQGYYAAGNGTFVLNGNVTQQVTHSSDSIYVLALSGSGDKVITDEVQVVHDLQFNMPLLLKTATTGAIVIHDHATITGAGGTAYVDGILYHEGVGKKVFPIGVSGRYLPIVLDNIASSTSDPVTGFSLLASGAGVVADVSLSSVSDKRYAQILQRKGMISGAVISLSIGDDEIQTLATDMVVAEADVANGPYRSLGQSAIDLTVSPPLVTGGGPITGRYFAIGTKDSGHGSDGVYVPSAFSTLATNPDDQVVKVYGDLVSPTDFEFRIFSNWGNVIFESHSLTEMQTTGWKGYERHSGELVSIGTYTYSMQGKFINGKAFKKSGSITFIK